MNFDEWYLSEGLGEEYTDPEELARAAWSEAYRRATEEAARLCEMHSPNKLGNGLAYLIRQAAEDV